MSLQSRRQPARGKARKLGVPTVVDRVIQKAITQELTPIFEEQFSNNSFGYRRTLIRSITAS